MGKESCIGRESRPIFLEIVQYLCKMSIDIYQRMCDSYLVFSNWGRVSESYFFELREKKSEINKPRLGLKSLFKLQKQKVILSI